MKNIIRIVVSIVFICALLGAATFMVVKYFDVLTACLKRFKETLVEKKHVFFSAHSNDHDEEDADEVLI